MEVPQHLKKKLYEAESSCNQNPNFPIEAVEPTRTHMQFKIIIINKATIFF